MIFVFVPTLGSSWSWSPVFLSSLPPFSYPSRLPLSWVQDSVSVTHVFQLCPLFKRFLNPFDLGSPVYGLYSSFLSCTGPTDSLLEAGTEKVLDTFNVGSNYNKPLIRRRDYYDDIRGSFCWPKYDNFRISILLPSGQTNGVGPLKEISLNRP